MNTEIELAASAPMVDDDVAVDTSEADREARPLGADEVLAVSGGPVIGNRPAW